MTSPLPRVRLSAFYLVYFAGLGILVPYWGLYLESRGFEPRDVGLVVAVLLGMRVIAPNVWGWVADRTGHRMAVIRGAALMAPAVFAVFLAGPGLLGTVLTMAAFSFAWSGVLPQYEANTLDHLSGRPYAYGFIRVWGSIGFILAVAAGGWWFDDTGIGWVPAVVLGLMLGIAVTAWNTPAAAGHPTCSDGAGFWGTLKQPAVVALFLVCFLMQASFGPYYAFFSIYMESLGYSTTVTGLLWAWGVAAEVVVFLYTPRLLERYGPRTLMLFALGATVVRWLATAYLAGVLPVMFLAQTLHMAGFGIFHAVAVVLVHRAFPGRLHGRGQALYSSLGFGLGGSLGSLAAGFAWESVGPTATYATAAVVVAVAWCVAAVGLEKTARTRGANEEPVS